MEDKSQDGPKTRFVGFKCPIGVYKEHLEGHSNISRVIINSLTGVKPEVKPDESVKLVQLNRIFLKLFNGLADEDSSLARDLFELLSSEEQVMLREFLESNQ